MEITTQRFILRPLTRADASKEYLSWLNNQETAQYIENCQQELAELADYIDKQYNNPKCLFLGIFTIDNYLHIGNIKYELMESHPNVATMGILIGNTSYHGKGVAGEVLLGSFPAVSAQLNAGKVNLGVEKANLAAIRAYEKVGFRRVNNGYYHFDDDAIEMVIDI
ncbi:GNAT family N-acetyltransferase [Colwellia sp. MEBiC06753]